MVQLPSKRPASPQDLTNALEDLRRAVENYKQRIKEKYGASIVSDTSVNDATSQVLISDESPVESVSTKIPEPDPAPVKDDKSASASPSWLNRLVGRVFIWLGINRV